jgi:hypothetical protein
MNAAVLSATSALAGSTIGAVTSFATTWLSQTYQLRFQQRGQEAAKREALYADFIAEAAKRLVDAMSHEAESPDVLIMLYAAVNRMRLMSGNDVIDAAENVVQAVVEAYAAPNRSFQELRASARDGRRLNPLAKFGEACRAELNSLGK